jgi:hypothetical protein
VGLFVLECRSSLTPLPAWREYIPPRIRDMLELSPIQIAILERIACRGFTIVAFPLYGSAAGVRRGDCAALLVPVSGAGMKILGEPSWLVAGNMSVRVRRNGSDVFVWKKEQVQVTPERLVELATFRSDLEGMLAPEA